MTTTLEIPAAEYPAITRLISDAFFPQEPPPTEHRVDCPHCRGPVQIRVPAQPQKNVEPVVWGVGQPHPLLPALTVARMFVVHGGMAVHVYSHSKDGLKTIRNTIPMRYVRLVEEGMPVDVYVAEMESAELGDFEGFPVQNENDDEEDSPEIEGEESADEPTGDDAQQAPNGQAST